MRKQTRTFRPALSIAMRAFWWRIHLVFGNKLADKFGVNPGLGYRASINRGQIANARWDPDKERGERIETSGCSKGRGKVLLAAMTSPLAAVVQDICA